MGVEVGRLRTASRRHFSSSWRAPQGVTYSACVAQKASTKPTKRIAHSGLASHRCTSACTLKAFETSSMSSSRTSMEMFVEAMNDHALRCEANRLRSAGVGQLHSGRSAATFCGKTAGSQFGTRSARRATAAARSYLDSHPEMMTAGMALAARVPRGTSSSNSAVTARSESAYDVKGCSHAGTCCRRVHAAQSVHRLGVRPRSSSKHSSGASEKT